MKKQKGFTLIEMLVVIAIIGIMITIALLSYQSSMRKSRDAKRKADVETIIVALELYRDVHGCFPNNSGIITTGGALATALHDYLPEMPQDPSHDGVNFYYVYNANHCDSGDPGGYKPVIGIRRFEITNEIERETECGALNILPFNRVLKGKSCP